MARLKITFFVVVLFALGAAVFVPAFVKQLNALFIKTVPAVVEMLEDERTLHALVLRGETVVRAPVAGTFASLVKEESRVRAGQFLGMILRAEDQVSIYAPRPGIVRFHWDGWEAALTEQSVWQWAPDEWRERGKSTDWDDFVRTPEGRALDEGTPLLRLTESHGVRLYVTAPEGAGWRAGQTVTVHAADVTEEPLRAKIVEIGQTSSSGVAVAMLEVDRYLPVLDAVRHIEMTVVLSRLEGVVVSVDSLVWHEGRPGVLIKRSDGTNFVPVRVLGQVGERVALDGIPPGVDIVANPARIPSW